MYNEVKIGVVCRDSCGVVVELLWSCYEVVCGSGIWKLARKQVGFKYSFSSPLLPGHQLSSWLFLSHRAVLVVIGSESLAFFLIFSLLTCTHQLFHLPVNQINLTCLTATLIPPFFSLLFSSSVKPLRTPSVPDERLCKRSIPLAANWFRWLCCW